MRWRAAGVLACGLALMVPPAAVPRSAVAAPGRPNIALVLTYKTRPESRTAFRAHLEQTALPQIAAWQRAGLFADHLALFGVDVNEDAWDAFVLLRFADWVQYARWKETERSAPAGLTPEGLRLVSSVSSALSQVVDEGSAPAARRRAAGPAVFFVRPYYFQDAGLYRRFYDAYNAPQLAAWAREGAVNAFQVLLNQNWTGGTWGVLFVYEYADWEAANARDDVKGAMQAELSARPAWDLLGETKGAIRTSGRVTLAERLSPVPGPMKQ